MRLLRDRQDLAKESMGTVGRLLQMQKHGITSIVCHGMFRAAHAHRYTSALPWLQLRSLRNMASLPWKLHPLNSCENIHTYSATPPHPVPSAQCLYRLKLSRRACRSSSPASPPPTACATRPSGTAAFWIPVGVSPSCEVVSMSPNRIVARLTAAPRSMPNSSMTWLTTSSLSSSSSAPMASSTASSIISCR